VRHPLLLLGAQVLKLSADGPLLDYRTHDAVGGDGAWHKERGIPEYGIDLVLSSLKHTARWTLCEMLLQRWDIRLSQITVPLSNQ